VTLVISISEEGEPVLGLGMGRSDRLLHVLPEEHHPEGNLESPERLEKQK